MVFPFGLGFGTNSARLGTVKGNFTLFKHKTRQTRDSLKAESHRSMKYLVEGEKRTLSQSDATRPELRALIMPVLLRPSRISKNPLAPLSSPFSLSLSHLQGAHMSPEKIATDFIEFASPSIPYDWSWTIFMLRTFSY